jgi:hypothetical protein
MNMKRRHLTLSQLATAAVELEPFEAEQAKKRQATSTGGTNPQLVQKIAHADKGRASAKVGV